MKILHIIPSLQIGGAERLTVDICSELNKRNGYETALLSLHEANEFPSTTSDITILHTNSSFQYHVFRKSESDFTDYKQVVNHFKPDIIHSHLFEAEFFSRQSLFPAVGYVSHLHDNMGQFNNFNIGTLVNRKKLSTYFEKMLLLKQYAACSNYFLANSTNTYEHFKQVLPSKFHSHLIYLPNAINLTRFKAVERKINFNAPLRLISTGSLVTKKNHSFLLDVMLELKERNKSAVLTILGDGPLRPALEKKIESLGLNDNVHLEGKTDLVENYLQRADLYVHSATYEPFGLVLLEAMATGLPVICLDGKGNRELIQEGYNGFMLHSSNVKLFVDKVLEVINTHEQYEHFSQNAIDYAKKFDIVTYADRLIALYEKVIHKEKIS